MPSLDAGHEWGAGGHPREHCPPQPWPVARRQCLGPRLLTPLKALSPRVGIWDQETAAT